VRPLPSYFGKLFVFRQSHNYRLHRPRNAEGAAVNDQKAPRRWQTRCRLSERFASAWPELIIACAARERGEWLHRCSWQPRQLACAAYRLYSHAFGLQTDRRTDITVWLHIASFAFTVALVNSSKGHLIIPKRVQWRPIHTL